MRTERHKTRKKEFVLRKRRIIIPCVFLIALLIGGQVYDYAKKDRTIVDNMAPLASAQMQDVQTENSVVSGTGAGTGAAVNAGTGAAITGESVPVKVKFYAGDDFVKTVKVTPNSGKKLPKPEKDGYEFAGWYTARTDGALITKDDTGDLQDGDTLYARWTKTSEEEDHSGNGLPVLMYHWFYDTEQGDPYPTSLINNWMKVSQFDEEIAWLKSAGYYFPSWDEVYAYVRGEIDLPAKSIVVTIDDGKKSFYEYAVPIFEKYGVRGTGFLIAHKVSKKKVKKYSSDVVSLQSHTWAMHDGAGDKSLIQILPTEEAVADLTSAAAILGTNDALAYPFGYFDDQAVAACAGAGIHMAFGTSGGNVFPGMDPLRLPRVRISSNHSVEGFKLDFPAE